MLNWRLNVSTNCATFSGIALTVGRKSNIQFNQTNLLYTIVAWAGNRANRLARRILNDDSFFGAPQLRRTPLDGGTLCDNKDEPPSQRRRDLSFYRHCDRCISPRFAPRQDSGTAPSP